MMAAKLEWVRDANGWWHAPRSCGTKGGYWSIAVNNDGMFLIAGETEKRWHTLSDAKAYCQAQEDAAAPAELPAPGDVWGVPGKPLTWRRVTCVYENGYTSYDVWGSNTGNMHWHQWAKGTGAVRIDGKGKHDSQWREELAKFTDLLEYAKSELDAERARVKELETLATERLNKLEDTKSDSQGWKTKYETAVDGIKYAITSLYEAPEDDGLCRGVRHHLCGVITEGAAGAYLTELDRESEQADVAQARVAALEAEAARLRAKLDNEKLCRVYYQDIVYWVCNWVDQIRGGERVVCGSASEPCDGVQRGLEDIALRLQAVAHERDDLRTECARLRGDALAAVAAKQESEAARGRLLEALRGIEGMPPTAYPSGVHPWALRLVDDMRRKAREAREKEEGGRG